MIVKLDLEINISQRFVFDGFNHGYVPMVGIKVNSYDRRFQAVNCIQENQLFIAKNNMRILSTLQLPKGKIANHALVLPSIYELGITINSDFLNDYDRKTYIKRLYNCVGEWANSWWGFSGDSPSIIVVKDKRWIVECESKDEKFEDIIEVKEEKSTKFYDEWMYREIDNENVFLIT